MMLTNLNIATLPWQATSPDFAPIEYVWDILGRNVKRRHNVRTCHHMIAAGSDPPAWH